MKLRRTSPLIRTSCQEEQEWNREQLSLNATEPRFRLWAYRDPAVVLGCSQRDQVSAEQAFERAGIGVATRQTGGGAVLVGPWMLSASIVLPLSHPLAASNLIERYRWLGDRFASVLCRLGISAHAISPQEAQQLQQLSNGALDWACYGGFSPWEVVVGRRKILGLAQVRKRTGVLLVAGLLLHHPDWSLLCRVMGTPPMDANLLQCCTTSCAEQLGRVLPLPEIATPLAIAFARGLETSNTSCQIEASAISTTKVAMPVGMH